MPEKREVDRMIVTRHGQPVGRIIGEEKAKKIEKQMACVKGEAYEI